MLTKDQLTGLSKKFKIDRTLIFREYLQLIFLQEAYTDSRANQLCFKGGTAMHLLLNSPRFSEDLDFSTDLTRKEITSLVKRIEKRLSQQLENTKITLLYAGRKSTRYKIKTTSPFFKYPLNIRLDFAEEKIFNREKSPLVTEFPLMLFPLVVHLTGAEILAEKIRALLTRAKGRDFFDLWFLLAKKTAFNTKFVQEKLKAIGMTYSWEKLQEKIKSAPPTKISQDLAPFLPTSQRVILPSLKKLLLKEIELIHE